MGNPRQLALLNYPESNNENWRKIEAGMAVKEYTNNICMDNHIHYTSGRPSFIKFPKEGEQNEQVWEQGGKAIYLCA